MSNAFFQTPNAINEPVKSYAKGSADRLGLLACYHEMYNQNIIDVPMYIGSNEVRTSNKKPMNPPHDHQKVLGYFNFGDGEHVNAAIDAAMHARNAWSNLPWEDRAAIFLKAADLLAGPFRNKMNAATMLAQSKNVFQAEIDAACELIDFLRFNVQYMTQIYKDQPESSPGVWNRLQYRPLEGFVLAISPFNFTAIAGNLVMTPAMVGNVVVWKPSPMAIYSNYLVYKILEEAGAVISEYPPGTPGSKFSFPQRNRIISGLSLGTLVIEAKEKSGALITANFAISQKRKLFAIPGPIHSLNSKGPNRLIKNGAAKLVDSSQDILKD